MMLGRSPSIGEFKRLMVMPKQVSVTATQLRVSPLKAHDPSAHGARISQKYKADVRVELTQVLVELLFLQLFKPEL